MSAVNSINTGSGSKLTAINTNNVPDHTRTFVETVKDWFRLEKLNAATADGITIIQPAVGPGRWIRVNEAALEWSTQTTWFIDSSGGLDENTGIDSGHAIKTHSEFARRIGNNPIKQQITVTLVNDLPANDPMIVDFNTPELTSGYTIRYHGTRTILTSATFASFNARNPASNLPNRATSVAVPSWTTYATGGVFVVPTTGGAAGTAAYVAKDVSGTARLSTFWNSSTETEINPSPGDAFNIVSITKIHNFTLVRGFAQLFDLYFLVNPGTDTGLILESLVYFVTCSFDFGTFFIGEPFFSNCRTDGAQSSFSSCSITWEAGLLTGNGSSSTNIFLDSGADVGFTNGSIFQSTFLNVSNAAYARLYDCGFFDAQTVHDSAIEVVTEGRLRMQTVWGSGANRYGCHVDATGKVALFSGQSAVTVTGVLGDVNVNGAVRGWASMPFIDVNSEASVVVPGITPASNASGNVVTQTAWYIDPSTGDDNNTGADSGHPIRTGAEFSRRTFNGIWNSGVYSIYIISDLLDPDYLSITGIRLSAATITIHGSTTAGHGQSTLYNSVAGMTARVSQVRATNTRGTITDAAVPGGTWTAASLISSGTSPNKRIRILDGANAGAIAWAQKDLGAGQVAVSQWIVPTVSGVLPSALPVEVTVAGTEHFVVEQLTHIDNLSITTTPMDLASTNTSGRGVYCESLDFFKVSTLGSAIEIPNENCQFIGCSGVSVGSNGSSIRSPLADLVACHTTGGPIFADLLTVYACHHTTLNWLVASGCVLLLDGDTISQGIRCANVRRAGVLRVGTAAVFDSPTFGIEVRGEAVMTIANQNVGVSMLWGSGNTNYGIGLSVASAGIGTSSVAYSPSEKPIITGIQGDVLVAQVPKSWADIPYIDAATLSRITAF